MFKKRRPKLLYYYSLPREPIPVNDIPDPSTSDLLELPEIRVTSPSFLGREEVIVQKGKNPQLLEDNAISDVTTETDAICNGAEKETITIRRVHEDEVDRLPQRLRVETFDLLCYLFSIFTYVTDLCLDVVVAYMHYTSERYWSCAIIASLVVFPSLILNILAAIWWIDDDLSQRQKLKRLSHRDRYSLAHRHHRIHKRSLTTRLLICVLQLGPVLWYWEALEAALRYRKEIKKPEQKRNPKFALKYYCEMVEAERDASLLRFFESFLESVPQLLVQGFLLAETFWKIHASEELAIIPDWGTSFACMDIGLTMINAAIHLFTPFNMAEGTTRWQYSAAYAIEFLEDMVLMCLCLFNSAFDFPFKWYIAAVALGCFVIGIAVMLAYYEFFHPSRRRNCARHFQKCEPLAVSITQTKKKELVITNGVKSEP
ncbi:XK-related protein [Ditylenchus destructor]|nr:XK-related protein [Ditylenchus destructor]